jgi:hypothetical protein
MGVIQIAEDPAFGGAGHNTGGIETLIDTVDAKVTLHYDAFRIVLLALLERRLTLRKISVLLFVEGTRTVRTSLHAAPATDAEVVVDENNAVFPLGCRAGWANLHASRVAAMVTEYRQKDSPRRRILSHLFLQNFAKENSRRRSVLRFTGHRTSVAADADIEINAHPIARHERPPILSFMVPGSTFNVPLPRSCL